MYLESDLSFPRALELILCQGIFIPKAEVDRVVFHDIMQQKGLPTTNPSSWLLWLIVAVPTSSQAGLQLPFIVAVRPPPFQGLPETLTTSGLKSMRSDRHATQ